MRPTGREVITSWDWGVITSQAISLAFCAEQAWAGITVCRRLRYWKMIEVSPCCSPFLWPEFLQMRSMSMTCAPFHIHDKNMFLNQYCIFLLAAAHLSFCVLILAIRNIPVIFFSIFYLLFNPNALRHLSLYSFKILWPIIVNYKDNRHLSVCILFDFWVAFYMKDFHDTQTHTHTHIERERERERERTIMNHYQSAIYSSH